MAKKKTAPKKKAAPTATDDSALGLVARGAFEIAAAINKAADELKAPYDFHDGVNDSLGRFCISLDTLADAMAMTVIAAHGSDDDRRSAPS